MHDAWCSDVRVHAWMYVCIYSFMHVCMHACMYVRACGVHTCAHPYASICSCKLACVHVSVYAWMYVSMHAFMYPSMEAGR